jgi:hypothetical protein
MGILRMKNYRISPERMWENGGTSRDLSWKICFVDFMELGNVENS